MATATVEITLPGLTGFTLTLDLYPLGSDTAAASGLSLAEETNRKCTYTATTNAGLAGAYLAVAKEGSTVRGAGYVGMTDTANVHIVGIDLPGKVLGGGSGTISGTGARVVDGDGDAVAKASAVAAAASSASSAASSASTAASQATLAVKLAKAQAVTDTGQTPWQEVLIEQGTGGLGVGTELRRVALKQTDGTGVTSTNHVVGQKVDVS